MADIEHHTPGAPFADASAASAGAGVMASPMPAPGSLFVMPGPAIPVLIVAFRNAGDVLRCLSALSRMRPDPAFAVFICENGGPAAFDEQLSTLTGPAGVCDIETELADVPRLSAPRLSRIANLRLRRAPDSPPVRVQLGEATANLGYAGGVNSFLGPLLEDTRWPGAWVLNPDTEPAPDALRELKIYAGRHDRCMVGSRLVTEFDQEYVQMRGLAWRRWRGATAAVDRLGPVVPAQPADLVEGRLDAASGASVYVTRSCIMHIGLMDERYFLYFEDLEWGMRAKRRSPIGYASQSIVIHECGTTTGSPSSRRGQSSLTTYLDFRNRLLFVRRYYGWWLAWMALIEVLELADHARRGEFGSLRAAARGLVAGLLDRDGRPDMVMSAHTRMADGPGAAPPRVRHRRLAAKDLAKIAISAGACSVLLTGRSVAKALGRPRLADMNILYYHGVKAECAAGFARQMRQLARWARVVRADWTGDGVADGRPVVAITFDDAFVSVLDHALPILASHGFPCTIFVPTGHIGNGPSWTMDNRVVNDDRVASADRLAAIDPELVTLGSHTVTHPHLPVLTPDAVRQELVRSRQDIAGLTGREPTLFAFPYGARSDAAVAACRDCGYERAFTIEPTPVVLARNAFERGRVAVEPSDGPLEFYLKATGCYRWMPRVSAIKHANRRVRPAMRSAG